MNKSSTLNLKPQADPFVRAMINDARAEIAACGEAVANSQSSIADSRRCPICGTALQGAESCLCEHCHAAAREELDIINTHFRVPAGELARVNPSFIRRMA